MNACSSRSHAILILRVSRTDLRTGVSTTSRLYMVDLAGSERLSRTGAVGLRKTEAESINLSLMALGNVIAALTKKATRKNRFNHIPYRDSKLTHLLSCCFGGNARTTLIVNTSSHP